MSRTPSWRRALPLPAEGKGNLRIYAKQDVGGATVESVFDYRDLPTGVVTKILKFIQEAKPQVHILSAGRALCGLPGMPKDWPEGHTWIAFPKDWPEGLARAGEGEATCMLCIQSAKQIDKGT